MLKVSVNEVRGTTVTHVGSIPPAQSAGQAKDLNEFIDLAAIALVDYQRRLGIVESERLVLREAYPKDPVESPDRGIGLALFRVISRKFMNTSNDGERRPRRPTTRESVSHPDDPTLMLTVCAQEMDNIVEFRVVSPHAKRANEMALLFERFIMAYTFYFRDMGLAHIYFMERLEDTIEVIGGNELHVRPLRFYVRTQVITQQIAKLIDEVLVEYDTGPLLRTEKINEQYDIENYSVKHTGSTS